MQRTPATDEQISELLLQAIETERGGILVFAAAIEAALDENVRTESRRCLEAACWRKEVLTATCRQRGVDPDQSSPAREILALHRASLVRAIMMAVANGDPEAAQVVAAECVLLADMKKHLDWDLVRDAVSQAGMQFCSGPEARQEMDDGCCPLDCTRGWCREQWMSSLDFPAVVPSPREQAERAGVAGTPSTRVSRTSE